MRPASVIPANFLKFALGPLIENFKSTQSACNTLSSSIPNFTIYGTISPAAESRANADMHCIRCVLPVLRRKIPKYNSLGIHIGIVQQIWTRRFATTIS